ncbi:MAG: L-aspartate oxidase [Coleofasciculus sp. D1-CHI-01]|uniref:L-aspartate oxidase n=1 Tax=Coleofasciculus sp. D1-CHI-01 TaxID=3068482 RepID=UPI0032FEBC31
MISVPDNSQSPLHQPTQFDVVVVGAGAAGLYAALCLPDRLNVALITKDTLSIGASDWAQGGIAAAIAPGDSPVLHVEDTLRAGAGLCDADAVEFLAQQAPDRIRSLVEMGVTFDRRGEQLALTLEAAHSRPRVLHAADTTGRAVVSTLTALVLRQANITVLERAFALSVWLNPDTGDCQGVQLMYQGQISWRRAGAVVLATGGGGQVFAQTTNPDVSTGDGVAIAWRAGAILRDLEFVQFHPTALTKPGAPHFLISEAVRGEGAHLVDDQGHRFAFEYHPDGELAPRDVVSRAIFSHLQKTKPDPATSHVYLDLRPIPDDQIRHRFPNIIQVCQQWGVDVFRDMIPVAPAAHYWMGGIATDLITCTSIPNLYAVGETASTGVHGANRLASNSLLECIVFGAQLGELTPDQSVLNQESGSQSPVSISPLTLSDEATKTDKMLAMQDQLKRLVWQSAGICRSAQKLERAIAQVEVWQAELAALPLSQQLRNLTPQKTVQLDVPNADYLVRTWGETSNLLDIAYLILKSALFRTESRGGHHRLDYPQPDPDWQMHTLVQEERWWKG